ncbi:MAG: chromate transporter, partial [Muribaculaceae bacterium]
MNIYFKIIIAYLKIGLFGFGGGYAMLSLIQREVVESGWISSQLFTDIVAISQMTPGPIGINSATYIGYALTGSILGSIVATITVVAPPFALILLTGHYINRHKESPYIKGAFMGLRPVVVGLIASAALLLMNSENFGSHQSELFKTIPICIASFCIVYFT